MDSISVHTLMLNSGIIRMVLSGSVGVLVYVNVHMHVIENRGVDIFLNMSFRLLSTLVCSWMCVHRAIFGVAGGGLEGGQCQPRTTPLVALSLVTVSL